MRCFVALDLPEPVRAALAALGERLRAEAPRADVRWVPSPALHLTLRFLGEVPDAVVARIVTALSALAARQSPMALSLAGCGVFPGPGRPRVVWAGVGEGAGVVGRLAAEIEHAVVALGVPAERRPFQGHITLARVRSPRGIQGLVRALAPLAQTPLGAWTATDLVLFRSHLGPQGARYEVVARLPFANVEPG